LVFCRHESQRSKNQKSCFLPTLGQTKQIEKSNFDTWKIEIL